MTTIPSSQLAKRQGYGNLGIKTNVKTNHFPIQNNNSGTIYHYDVTITPDVPQAINREVFHAFEIKNAKIKNVLNNIAIVYDGVKNMFSPRALPLGKEFTDEVILPEKDAKPSKNPRIFKVKIMRVNEIPVDIDEMYDQTNTGLTAIMAFNVLFRHQPNTSFIQQKNSFYIRKNVSKLSGGVEVWPGFFRSFNPGADGFALNVDTSKGLRNVDELRDPRLQAHHKRIKSFLKGLRIVLNYRGESKREYKVRDLTKDSAEAHTFSLVKDGKDIGKTTVLNYYQKYNGIKLRYPMLPCIEIKKGVVVPLEVCDILPGQRYQKKLDQDQTAEMIKITCVSPRDRMNKILEGIKLMAYENNDYIKQFNLKVSTEMKTVPARIIPFPHVKYHPSSKEKVVKPFDGAWNLRDKKVSEGKILKNWAVFVFGAEGRIKRAQVQNFITELVIVCKATGMQITNERPNISYLSPRLPVDNTIGETMNALKQSLKEKPQLILCILPDRGAPLYGSIKSAFELKYSIPTQCVQSDKTFRPNKQYCANVCLKMNAKLGGINASLDQRDLNLKDSGTLIIGADVSHPGASDQPSIAAIIGSVDFSACRFTSSIRVQRSRVEVIEDLQSMVVELLKYFYKETKAKPQRILYYRDGLSDGQFSSVLAFEMTAIKKACLSLEATYKPPVTYCVVQKRHHTRFFPMSEKDMDKSKNCKPGTVVETNICHPKYFDFYLQSHSGLQGTSRPSHYHVLVDENKYTTDKFQTLTYNLCYLFNRCTRAVSVVPPVYYAHLAAARARCHHKIGDSITDDYSLSHQTELDVDKANKTRVNPELAKTMYYV